MKKSLFAGIVLLTTLILILTIAGLRASSAYVNSSNAVYLSTIMKVVFAVSYVVLLIVEYSKSKTFKKLISVRNLLIFSLASLLIMSVFRKDIGIYATGFYVLCTLVYFAVNRELFEIKKIFYVVFIYALLELFGTIGTPGGFRFPEMSYSFYIIPLSFSLFYLEKHTMLRILKIFFRAIFIYVYISIIFWYFNFECFNVGIVDWITKKTAVEGLSVYEYICKWSNYTHPSYISLVLLSALISGFYLFYKKEKNATLSIFELAVFAAGCFILEFLLESRIGILEIFAVVFVSLIYYVKIKTSYFKLSLAAVFISVLFLYFFGEKHFGGMMGDEVRKADYTLAVNYIKNHPWWGSGYHRQREVLLIQDEIMKDVQRPSCAPPFTYTHNQFLGIMVQYGIWGLLVLLFFIISLFSYAFKSRSYPLQMLMFVYLVFMFIEEPLTVQEGITRFVVFASFFIILSKAEVPRRHIKLNNFFSKG